MNTNNAMLVRYATTASRTSVTSTCPLALRERIIKNTRTNNRRSTAYTIETNAMNTSRRRVTGGDQREIHVDVSRDRLDAYGITLTDLATSIKNADSNISIGFIQNGPVEEVMTESQAGRGRKSAVLVDGIGESLFQARKSEDKGREEVQTANNGAGLCRLI